MRCRARGLRSNRRLFFLDPIRKGFSPMSQTRSPLKHPAQRLPGQSVREQLVDVIFERLGSEIIAAWIGIYAAMEWMRWALRAAPGWRSCTLYTVIAVVYFVLMLRHRRRSEGMRAACRRADRADDQPQSFRAAGGALSWLVYRGLIIRPRGLGAGAQGVAGVFGS